jgi:hypothetical protein
MATVQDISSYKDVKSRQLLLHLGLGLGSLFCLFFLLARSSANLTIELRKANLPFRPAAPFLTNSPLIVDTLAPLPMDSSLIPQKERVLLLGDSQLEGLRGPIYKYCLTNKHQLVASVLWYGSSTRQWSRKDTLAYYLKKYKPSYVILAIGLNELFVNDMDNRRAYISQILETLKTAHVKYFWIGPAAWKEDKGITALLAEMTQPYFYPSHTLKLDRKPDRRHPTHKAAALWFDSVAVKMSLLKGRGIDFSVKKDTSAPTKNSPFVLLQQQLY